MAAKRHAAAGFFKLAFIDAVCCAAQAPHDGRRGMIGIRRQAADQEEHARRQRLRERFGIGADDLAIPF